jgi:multidrug resistance efflux pump
VSITRYDFSVENEELRLESWPDGEWVRYDAYEAEIQRLTAALQEEQADSLRLAAEVAVLRARLQEEQAESLRQAEIARDALTEAERLTEALRDANVALVRIKLAVDDARTRTLAALAAAEEGGDE